MFPEEEDSKVFYAISIMMLLAFFVVLKIMWTVWFFVSSILIDGIDRRLSLDQEEMTVFVFDVESQSRR